jgi:hypothetical protein
MHKNEPKLHFPDEPISSCNQLNNLSLLWGRLVTYAPIGNRRQADPIGKKMGTHQTFRRASTFVCSPCETAGHKLLK